MADGVIGRDDTISGDRVTSLEQIVEQGDLDQLVRTVDRLCETRDWDGLVELRDRCRWALERGKQLWPAASLAEYRLALEAPGKWAAGVLAEGAGRFALGPLPEVAASTHTWGELAPHLAPGPLAAITAHERVLRGEDLRGEDIDGRVLEVPLALTSWEPEYPLAEYEQDKAAFPSPPPVALSSIELDSGEVAEDPTTIEALLALTTRWTVESNGRSEAVAVRGTAPAAIAALGVRRARVAEIAASDGLAWMAWAAASWRRARSTPRHGDRTVRRVVGGGCARRCTR